MGLGFICQGGYGGGSCHDHKSSGIPPINAITKTNRNTSSSTGTIRSTRASGSSRPATAGVVGGGGGADVSNVTDVPGASHYWINIGSNQGYTNATSGGLGCNRNSAPGGTNFSGQFAPAVRCGVLRPPRHGSAHHHDYCTTRGASCGVAMRHPRRSPGNYRFKMLTRAPL